MVRASLRLMVSALLLSSLVGCSMLRAGAQGAAPQQRKKDCAACKKMCEVAADAEKNKAAVDKCKADCDKSCE